MAHGGARKGAGRKPGVLSEAKKEISSIAKEHAESALQTLVSIAQSSDEAAAARVSAANSILDRAYGKPVQQNYNQNENTHEVSNNLASLMEKIDGRTRSK